MHPSWQWSPKLWCLEILIWGLSRSCHFILFFFFLPSLPVARCSFFNVFILDTLKSNKVFLRGIIYYNCIILSFSLCHYATCHILSRRVGCICLQDQLQKMYLILNLSLALEWSQANLSRNQQYLCDHKSLSIRLRIAVLILPSSICFPLSHLKV